MAKMNTARYLQKPTGTTEWLIVNNSDSDNCAGKISLKSVTFPNSFIGKKIRIKIEVIKHEKKRL